MTRLYVRKGASYNRKWVAIGWICDHPRVGCREVVLDDVDVDDAGDTR